MKNILYLGMATDIMFPLLAEPDFDTLFVINIIDTAFGTWDEQRKHILSILEEGNDSKIDSYENFYEDNGMQTKRIHELSGPCEILSNEGYDMEFIEEEYLSWKTLTAIDGVHKPWRVSFIYENKVRNLVYFCQDFLEEWNPEIKDIQSIFWIGAYNWDDLGDEEAKPLINMIETRSSLPLTFYGDSHINKLFPIHLHYYCGKERDGNKIVKKVLPNFDDIDVKSWHDSGKFRPWWFNYNCVEDSYLSENEDSNKYESYLF